MRRPAQTLRPREATVLTLLLAADREMTALEIGRDSGFYQNGTPQTWAELGSSLIRPLLIAGAAAKCGRKPLRFEITERGRIALALFKAIANRKVRHGTHG
ncbi:hypothetical protein DXU07_45305 [Bradyrhizobium elkanii]|uniref:hypothetical protein n=1 Tax=Bradyrhizobium elkanii TaxID=29448 RepID=UPI0009216E73|nr:hypothetical protein [Bradyrhizobium elkanii]MCW2194973.1 hypothetical protein [Bradyrhizobium elkanii]NWL67328.1 hypothetical protein [Bradyrhizobium elkanii]OIM93807.1 hypothetical protein BLN97_14130 [Bradyrhizobium elkanii]